MKRVSDLDKMAKLLDEELEVFCGKVFPTLTLPIVRFVKEFCTGMAVAKSTVISRIARAIRPTSAETKTFLNMTSRYLEKRGLDRTFNRAVAHDVGKTVKRDTLLLMDPTDIVKPFSSGKQEYIAKVRDGSTGKRHADGYSGCMVAACECGGKRPRPLWFELWSSEAPDFVSENDCLIGILKEVYHATQGKGIVVFDRGADRWVLMRELVKMNGRFIIRLVGNRNLIYRGHKRLAKDIAKVCVPTLCTSITTRRDGETRKRQLSIGSVTVRLPLANAAERLEMVVVKGFGEEPMMLLTTELGTKTQHHLHFILEAYLTRWRIEDSFRYLKESYELEDVRLLGYQRLKTLVALLGILFAFLAHHLPALGNVILKTLLTLSKRTTQKLPEFFYYAISDSVSELFHYARHHFKKRPRYGIYKPPDDELPLEFPRAAFS